MSRHTPALVSSAPSRLAPKERACDGKKRYGTVEHALRQARHILDVKGMRLDVFRCGFCGSVHLCHALRNPEFRATCIARASKEASPGGPSNARDDRSFPFAPQALPS